MDELYIIARRVLLDALNALGSHRGALVLVGAQAIYLRVGDADIAVAPYTTDADLAIDPTALAEVPPIEQALRIAGFAPESGSSVGIWVTHRPTTAQREVSVAVDLLVPRSVSPGLGRRAARLPGHDSRAARIVSGLDGALVDVDLMQLGSLESEDTRSFEMRVAGPAALLVAKLHKIHERHGSSRQSDKDALDVLRLLRGTETAELALRYRRLLEDSLSRMAASGAIQMLREQFSRRRAPGVEMAVRSVGILADADEIAASCEILANDLLNALET